MPDSVNDRLAPADDGGPSPAPSSTPDAAVSIDLAGETLPEPLPDDPFPLVRRWYDQAHRRLDLPAERGGPRRVLNPNAFTLATVERDAAGELRPDARVVLCKDLDDAEGRVTFYTSYAGRKGRELAAHPRAAAVFHWDDLERQVRIEGPVTRSPAAESDAYFARRPVASRVGAWSSDQSEPVASRSALLERVAGRMVELAERAGLPLAALAEALEQTDTQAHGDPGAERPDELDIPRPPHWGGFRLWAERVELWCGGPGRVHDRGRWERDLTPGAAGRPAAEHPVDRVAAYRGGPWRSTRLMP